MKMNVASPDIIKMYLRINVGVFFNKMMFKTNKKKRWVCNILTDYFHRLPVGESGLDLVDI